MSDDEIMRWARAADAGVPLALYTQELEPYTQEDVTAARRPDAERLWPGPH